MDQMKGSPTRTSEASVSSYASRFSGVAQEYAAKSAEYAAEYCEKIITLCLECIEAVCNV